VIDTQLDLNKQYVKIIDIQETQDVSFTVNWAYARAWARTLPDNLLGDLGTVGFLGADLFDYANGYIAVTPFTALQSPDGSNISVNVYISSPNMRFNHMMETNLPTQRPSTESGRLTPVEVQHMDLNKSTATMDHISELHYGETPISFRSLLKRFVSTFDSNANVVTPSGGLEMISYDNVPIYPNPTPAYGGAPITHKTLYGYLRYAYLGMRGGVRRRISLTGDMITPNLTMVRATLSLPSTGDIKNAFTSNDLQRLQSRMAGTLSYVPDTNGGIEIGLPNYTTNLFGISFSNNPYPTTSIVDNVLSRSFTVNIPTFPANGKNWATVTKLSVLDDFATAEDFSFMLFGGSPAYIFT
jgi:hypothetical protein